jgi:NNP family nitrate/nitrite transporter-like MFS transporter
MSILYIGTFGSFIGYSFALPLVIKNTFPEFLGHHPFIANYLAGLGFVGALVGSLTRPLGGWLSDRVGGARVTLASFAGMAAFTALAISGVSGHSFTMFFAAYMVIFAMAGIGNGSTYRMIPCIFAALGRQEAERSGGDPKRTRALFKRQSAAVIGIAGAIGAFGGFLIQVVFRQASLSTVVLMNKATKAIHDKHLLALKKAAIAHAHQGWSIPALWAFLGSYVVLAGMTWFFYMRKSLAIERAPSMAYAAV